MLLQMALFHPFFFGWVVFHYIYQHNACQHSGCFHVLAIVNNVAVKSVCHSFGMKSHSKWSLDLTFNLFIYLFLDLAFYNFKSCCGKLLLFTFPLIPLIIQSQMSRSGIICLCYWSSIYLFFFILQLLGSLFLAALGLLRYVWAFLQLWRVGTTLHCGAWASHCGGSPCCGAQALGAWASVFVALGFSSCRVWILELAGFSSCDVQAQ